MCLGNKFRFHLLGKLQRLIGLRFGKYSQSSVTGVEPLSICHLVVTPATLQHNYLYITAYKEQVLVLFQ